MVRNCKANGLRNCFKKDTEGKAGAMIYIWTILSAWAQTVVNLLLWHYIFDTQGRALTVLTWAMTFAVNLGHTMVVDIFNVDNGYPNAPHLLTAFAILNAV